MRYIISQFGNPRGLIGRLVGNIMAVKTRERIMWGIAQLDIQKQDHILEIGFGPGTAIEHAATIATEGLVEGVEISQTMLNQATKRLSKSIKKEIVQLKLGSVSTLPYDDNMFDKVFASNSLLYWPNPIEDLKEIKRVLKTGGFVAIIQQPRSVKTGRAVEENGEKIANQITDAGFRDVIIDSKPMEPVTCLCVKGFKP